MRHKLLQIALLHFGLAFSGLCQADDAPGPLPYSFGQGFRYGDYYLSGYTNIQLTDPFGQPAKLSLEDLSFFIGGNSGRWLNPFTEIEFVRHTLIKQGGNPGHGNVVVERLYNDALLSDHDTLRIGKMLTPLGDWNTVFASPLVPTLTRPNTTALGFETNESGLTWIRDVQDGETPDLQLYLQPDYEWFERLPRETPRHFQNVFGAHINKPFGLIDKVGASFQHGELVETGEEYTVYGVNVIRSFGNLMLESEALTSHFYGRELPWAPPRLHAHEQGIFGLADYSFTAKWHGILEWERYQDHLVGGASRNTLIGIDFKPEPYMVWKFEYVHQSGTPTSFSPIQTGLNCSFSTLF
ncbi:MAG: hypothetical protein ACYCZR_13435 [Burkholderiales bacterium]